jgi:hypothetical protein
MRLTIIFQVHISSRYALKSAITLHRPASTSAFALREEKHSHTNDGSTEINKLEHINVA